MDNNSSGIITPTRGSGGRRNRTMSHLRLNSARSEKSKGGNPFDADCLQRLRKPLWSPTVMSCPDSTPPQSGWTIDQLSKLDPVDIEGSPSSHQEDQELSPGSENRIQGEILTFFSTFNDSSPFGNEIHPINYGEHNLSGDVEQLNGSGRTLDLDDVAFNQATIMDISTCSDGSDIDERKVHGGTFMSPTCRGRTSKLEKVPKTSPSTSSICIDVNMSLNDSAIMET